MPMRFRRVVTGHDANGKAVVLHDGPATNVNVRPVTGNVSTLLWVTDTAPAALSDMTPDPALRTIGVTPSPSGSILRIIEYPPGKEGADVMQAMAQDGIEIDQTGIQRKPSHRHHGMHRTESIDYAIVLRGAIDMLLDDSEVHLEAGDILVQQGTFHAWANRGIEPCAIAFVLIGAKVPWADER